MAIFKSTLLSDIRGSLNGSTFSRTRAGNILRNRTQPVQPDTAFQTDQRSKMMVATDAFKALTLTEVDEWADAIIGSGFTSQNALGDTYVPSAKQVFTSIFMNQLLAGATPGPDVGKFLSDPNLPGFTWGPVNITVAAGPPVVLGTFTIDNVNPTVDSQVLVKATVPQQPSIRNYRKYARILGSYPVTAGGDTVDIEADYLVRFPGIDWTDVLGQVIGLELRAISDLNGLGSAWLPIGQVVVPAAA